MLVENRTTIPITVVHLSYSGKTLARNLLIEAGHASEFFCMWPRTEAEIIVELMRHDESEASRHTFFAKQKIYQHRDFPVAVTERSTFLRKVGFMEGVDHSNCVWID